MEEKRTMSYGWTPGQDNDRCHPERRQGEDWDAYMQRVDDGHLQDKIDRFAMPTTVSEYKTWKAECLKLFGPMTDSDDDLIGRMKKALFVKTADALEFSVKYDHIERSDVRGLIDIDLENPDPKIPCFARCIAAIRTLDALLADGSFLSNDSMLMTCQKQYLVCRAWMIVCHDRENLIHCEKCNAWVTCRRHVHCPKCGSITESKSRPVRMELSMDWDQCSKCGWKSQEEPFD